MDQTIFKLFEEKGNEKMTEVIAETITKIQDMSMSCQDKLDELEQDLEDRDKIYKI